MDEPQRHYAEWKKPVSKHNILYDSMYSIQCLSPFRLLYKMVGLNQAFISHGSKGWEVQDQGFGRFGVWWWPISWFIDGHLLTVSSHGRRGKGVSFIKALIAFMRASPHFPKVSPVSTITLGISFQHINFGGWGGHRHSVYSIWHTQEDKTIV